jgi:subtilisin family serine protease
MRRLALLAIGTILLASCQDAETPLQPESASPAPNASVAVTGTGSYIVVLKAGADPRSVAAIMGIRPQLVYTAALNGFSAVLNQGQLNALRHNRNVDYIEPDQVMVLAPPPGKGPGGGGGGQVVPWGVTRVGGAGDGTGRTAWVIDTGVDLDHPDLTVDLARSISFVTRGKNTPDDGNGHGTHVAGTIAALNNGTDVIGVAAGASIVSVRVLDNSGSGSYSWVIGGVDHVARYGKSGDVANMSLGGPISDALDQAVLTAAGKGIRFALAAGNEGTHANNSSPARVNHANVYTISAISSNDCLTSWSNFGNPPVDYAAPGASILSLKAGGGTTTMSGTSMAAPHVAGILLLGGVRSSGNACNDPDGTADPIASR